MPATFSSICSRDSSTRSCDLPLGSPIMPVPPPTIAIGVWPNRCSRASPITVSSDPTCRLDAVGSNPMYAVTRSVAKQLGQALGGVVHQAAPRRTRRRDSSCGNPITIAVDGDQLGARSSRRCSPPASARVAGTGAYGYLVRAPRARGHARRRAGRRPAARAGRACASACSPTSTAAAGSRTTTSLARSRADGRAARISSCSAATT